MSIGFEIIFFFKSKHQQLFLEVTLTKNKCITNLTENNYFTNVIYLDLFTICHKQRLLSYSIKTALRLTHIVCEYFTIHHTITCKIYYYCSPPPNGLRQRNLSITYSIAFPNPIKCYSKCRHNLYKLQLLLNGK